MEYRSSGNQFIKKLISLISLIGISILIITATAAMLQIAAVLALAGGGIWCVHKLISFIKRSIHSRTAVHTGSREKLVVDIVTDPEIKASFSKINIIDVPYEEV